MRNLLWGHQGYGDGLLRLRRAEPRGETEKRIRADVFEIDRANDEKAQSPGRSRVPQRPNPSGVAKLVPRR